MFTFVHKQENPGDKGDQISDSPVYYSYVRVINRFPCAPLGIVNTMFCIKDIFF